MNHQKRYVMTVCGGIGDLLARLHVWEGRFWPAGEDVELLMATNEPKACAEIADDWGGFSGVKFVHESSVSWDVPSRMRELWTTHGRERVPFWDGEWIPTTARAPRFLDLGKWQSGWSSPRVADFPSFVKFSAEDERRAAEAVSRLSPEFVAIHPFPHSFSRGVPNAFWVKFAVALAESGRGFAVLGSARERDLAALSRALPWEKYGVEQSLAIGASATMGRLCSEYGGVDLRGELSLKQSALVMKMGAVRVVADSCLKEFVWDMRVPSLLVDADSAEMHAEMLKTFFWGVRDQETRGATRGELVHSFPGPGKDNVTFCLNDIHVVLNVSEIRGSRHASLIETGENVERRFIL